MHLSLIKDARESSLGFSSTLVFPPRGVPAAFGLLAHKVLSCLGQSRFLCLTGQPPGSTTTSTAHVILHDRHFASAVSADCLCRHSPLHLLSDFDPLVAGA